MKTLIFIILMSLMLAQKIIKNCNFHANQENTLINTEKLKVDECALVLIKNKLHH